MVFGVIDSQEASKNVLEGGLSLSSHFKDKKSDQRTNHHHIRLKTSSLRFSGFHGLWQKHVPSPWIFIFCFKILKSCFQYVEMSHKIQEALHLLKNGMKGSWNSGPNSFMAVAEAGCPLQAGHAP